MTFTFYLKNPIDINKQLFYNILEQKFDYCCEMIILRTILHSDCNGFYASVESLLHPELRGKPLAVAGDAENRHGIILAKNEEAKKYGIKTGEAIWIAKKKCPELQISEPHFDQYMRYSKLTKQMYAEYTDRVESFGLDEAWLDVTGNNRSGYEIAREIKERVKYELGITVSIGVSFNKIFAKLGSDYKKPDAITKIDFEGKDSYKTKIWQLPCEDLLYVGRATKKKLHTMGIYTIGDIAVTHVNILKSNLGKWGETLHSFANGLDSSPVAQFDQRPDVKSIGNSTTTPRDLCNYEDTKMIIHILCDSVSRRLRESGFRAGTVTISVRDKELFSFTRQGQLKNFSNHTKDIRDKALELFRNNYSFKKPVRSLGVSVSKLIADSAPLQLSFFEREDKHIREENLDKALDGLKNRFGSFAVRPAFLMKDVNLSLINPKDDHIIHPVGYF